MDGAISPVPVGGRVTIFVRDDPGLSRGSIAMGGSVVGSWVCERGPCRCVGIGVDSGDFELG